MRTIMFATGAAVASAMALGASIAPAFAQESDVVVTGKKAIVDPLPTKIVKYADLNLASAAGETTLLRRVKGAVSDVCRLDGRTVVHYMQRRDCRTFAWGGAQPQIDAAIQRARFNGYLTASTASIRISAQ